LDHLDTQTALCTRQRTKTKNNTTQKAKEMSNMDPRVNLGAREG